ncbi:uncharacterized protein CANTADRAFT_25703 [Suhomyces tanzawaensis NRRL Y-17324]|uniref:PH-domain-containing protein n=1 Tax=Suhomyces tanzawaensis NRRL Y-17324 TaxID=984487 RepID=A0A1E4SKD7_9ASCO|nr:uncharacterized protein CANTADRAFT_25703 [Suhomyces tanzawaensis NRRL Y-17324]ODV79897.1 hypothetical protein CANTADRAFT_25703 [Suhomyces tanzawaensis NRRL Y-17324]
MASSATVYICIKQFNARLGDELSLKIGDKVEVLADDSEYNDGWFMGKNLLTSEVGLYPKSFTQILQNQTSEPSLLRSRSRRVLSSNSTSSNTPVGTPNNVSKLTDKFGKLGMDEESSPANKANKTLSDIDKALQELQTENFLGSNGTSTKNNSLEEDINNNDANDSGQTEVLEGLKSNENTHKRNPSAQSLTEDLNPLKAAEWTPQQVSSYFAIVLGFDLDIAGKFARHKITGEILFQLDLAHLKELDIDSFGTRFEVHKEIDKLRQISSRSAKHKSLSRSTSKNNVTVGSTENENSFKESIPESSNTTDEFVSPPGSSNTSPNKISNFHNLKSSETDKRSSRHQSQLMPSADLKAGSYFKGHQRKRSQSLDNLHENRSSVIVNADLSFISPRKAPQPPNEPSPVDKNYKFGGASPLEQTSGLYVTRTNATGLGLVNGSRPSSSIYESSMVSHNRNASQNSQHYHHRRNSSVITGHRRHSSLFLFLSGNDEKPTNSKNSNKLQSNKIVKDNSNIDPDSAIDTDNDDDTVSVPKLISPAKVKRENSLFSPKQRKGNAEDEDIIDIDNTSFSPKKLKSISYKVDDLRKHEVDEKRSTSDSTGVAPSTNPVSRLKNLRTTSTQNFKSLTSSKKLKTSAFQEGIREVTPDEAIKSANHSGWMSKRSGNTLSWRSRYFTLHGTRLSYFTSLKDKKEKGLIDITAHKVIPVHAESDNSSGSNDKYIALYASSTGFGRYCFKLVPPAPGFKKGLMFTQPKTHYFAVDTQEEMRGWLKALMTATIDIDDSVPVVSSCSTPTVSLAKAQELLAKAREETRLKDEELRSKGFIRDGFDDYGLYLSELNTDIQTSLDSNNSPIIDSVDETTVSSVQPNSNGHPKLSIDTSASFSKSNTKTPSTPQISSNQGGFASPYLLASGLLSPRLGHSGNTSSPSGTPNSNLKTTDYFQESQTGNTPVASSTTTATANSEGTPKSVFSNSNGKVMSGRKKSVSEKMLAYTSDGSGNHTFVIKSKK